MIPLDTADCMATRLSLATIASTARVNSWTTSTQPLTTIHKEASLAENPIDLSGKLQISLKPIDII